MNQKIKAAVQHVFKTNPDANVVFRVKKDGQIFLKKSHAKNHAKDVKSSFEEISKESLDGKTAAKEQKAE